MLPVSGALQLNTSGAISERPIVSQSGAYSRLVRPAPSSLSGKKRFQRPGGARLCLHLLHDGRDRPAFGGSRLLLPVHPFAGLDNLVHERFQPLVQRADFGADFGQHEPYLLMRVS